MLDLARAVAAGPVVRAAPVYAPNAKPEKIVILRVISTAGQMRARKN
jgi:hypothetical protein